MQPASTDPYYVARDEMQEAIKQLRRQHDDWRRRLQNENTSGREFQQLNIEVREDVKQLDEDATDMVSMITMVKENRQSFPLDDAEIRSREDFVQGMRRDIKEIQDSLNSRQAQEKMDKDRQKLGGSRGAADDRAAQGKKENDAFLGRERQEQQLIERQQDDQLAALSRSAQRLNVTAQTINVELQDHQRMLQDLDDDIDRETEKLNFVMKRMGRLLQTSDNKQLCVIIALFVLMIVLLFLIIN